uniref:Claudin n=2 Tax=Petromyzon marinus TaxID=7757 RepID=S4RJV3_PETMA
MSGTCLQVLGTIIACLGWVGATVATAMNEWRVTSRASSVITATWVFQGLWMNCAGNALGAVHCRPHLTVFKLENYVQACRAFMITSVFLGCLAMICSPFGMACIRISFVSDKAKRNITFITGFICILQGKPRRLMGLTYSGNSVTVEYYDPTIIGAKYELGTALFIGWASALLTLTGGTIIVCSGVGRSYKQPRPWRALLPSPWRRFT